ncbi:MAG: MoaD/ThiS family protein [Actinobacteria bacterium]|nr:MoaD/ThiS family protein [Actinomycetota bacterium]
MKVRIPTPLRSYTAGEANVTAEGTTVRELLADLDRQFPGITFRVVDEQGRLRQHMVVFLGQDRCRQLDTPLDGIDEVVLMQALSGG